MSEYELKIVRGKGFEFPIYKDRMYIVFYFLADNPTASKDARLLLQILSVLYMCMYAPTRVFQEYNCWISTLHSLANGKV